MNGKIEPTFQCPLPGNRGSGLARMDEFESGATWDRGGVESLVLKFDDEQLSSEKRAQLGLFRVGMPPVMLQLAGGVQRQAQIVGYGARDNSFYLTWV